VLYAKIYTFSIAMVDDNNISMDGATAIVEALNQKQLLQVLNNSGNDHDMLPGINTKR
jgi:hypothetical protein